LCKKHVYQLFMEVLRQYIETTIGEDVQFENLEAAQKAKLPFYLSQTYQLFAAHLYNHELIFAKLIDTDSFTVSQSTNNLLKLNSLLNKPIVLVLDEIASYNRLRLIDKRVNFIVPGKQMFLPELFVDLRESFAKTQPEQQKQTLTPSSQFLLLFHLLNQDSKWHIEEKTFKDFAERLSYTAMSITKAAENLRQLDLITTAGEKEKYIRFKHDKMELWSQLEEQDLWKTPVLKQIYLDELPPNAVTLFSNTSALPEYSDVNPSRQEFLAMDKNNFYSLKKSNALIETNANEGRYCLEIWKYNPVLLANLVQDENSVVDPLSLYLCLKSETDERIEMVLEQIKKKFLW